MTRSTAAAAFGLALFLLLAPSAAASTPRISYTIDGISGTNGWYRGSTHGNNVIVHWSVSLDATSTNCLAAVTVPGPTRGTTLSCWAQNADGRATAVTRVVKIDATPPTGVTARLGRPPDFHGWYNRPVKIRWSGADATSGIAHCNSGTYRGPDSADAAVNGGCLDRAGNPGVFQVHLAYDATPPVLRRITEESTDTGNTLRWTSSSSSDRIVIHRAVRGRKARTTVFEGSASVGAFTDTKIRPGIQYVYSLRSLDEAGNASRARSVAGLLQVLTLRKTPYVPLSAQNPTLRWGPVRGASYYNVQLFRGSKRIYAAWPTMHQIGLSASWKWSGHTFRLTTGRYRWYVWAGFGPRRSARYRLIGSARFVIPRWSGAPAGARTPGSSR
jgi:hypothetical protein